MSRLGEPGFRSAPLGSCVHPLKLPVPMTLPSTEPHLARFLAGPDADLIFRR
jgi:hypothetical protein